MARKLRYMITDAPGYYGEVAYVWSRHYTIEAARRAMPLHQPGVCMRRGALPKGRTLYRSEENFYPMVKS